MGWNWDHATGNNSRSYTAHDELGAAIRSIAPRQDWNAVQSLFGRGSGDPFDIPTSVANRMATAFKAIAPLVGPTWTAACRDLGAAAGAAARAGAVWHWF